jgi:hypothetical protein
LLYIIRTGQPQNWARPCRQICGSTPRRAIKWAHEAIAILDKLKTTEKYVSPAELAILYGALGDKEKAFASLEKAFTERAFQLTSLKVEPGYDPLRADPRFQDLMVRVGLPQ